MSNKEYYKSWLTLKQQLDQALKDDARIQEQAVNYIGIKPQPAAVETVSRVYGKYCEIYNKLCDCYDQMEQVQRRPFIKQIIDAITCRIIELKRTLENVEVFEFTYTDNACQQMLIKPQDIDIVCPFFYPFEIRQAEMQYIIDQIFAGNRIGDNTPTASELELREQERLEEEERIREEKEAEVKRKLALGLDIEDDVSIQLSPAEIEAKRRREEYETHLYTIQRMERARNIVKRVTLKRHDDAQLYLELAGLRKPPARDSLRKKAALMIQSFLRQFMKVKREHDREKRLKTRIDMIISAYKAPSAKIPLEKIKAERRKFREAYYKKWLETKVTENARVLRLREGKIMEDISDEIREWFYHWFSWVQVFDDLPYKEQGGSILVVRGETFSIPEYLDWLEIETRKRKLEQSAAKSKDQIKQEKIAARAEKKRLIQEAKDKELKRIKDYKKMRLNPMNDPGVYIDIGEKAEALQLSWKDYQDMWKLFDEPDPHVDVIKGYIMQIITEDAYKNINLNLRSVVDEAMRLELDILKKAMNLDYEYYESVPPITKKYKKPRKVKEPKPEKLSPKKMFQFLADEGIVRQYPRVSIDDFWGDRNYAAADCRGVQWTPIFPPPSIGDVREQVRIRCLLTLGADCTGLRRTQLLVGPKGCGKRTLAYAVATETNSLLIDLSPLSVYNKCLGPKNTKLMFLYINKISRMMQPTVILVANAEKLFYKKVPPEEKPYDPTRFSKEFFKEIIKPIKGNDRILVIGTACEPWLAAKAKLSKVFPEVIMFPKTDYGSISLILKQMLMEYHGVDRDFNVHSIAQILRGCDIQTIRKVVTNVMSAKRQAELSYKPLEPLEIVEEILADKNAMFRDKYDDEVFNTWYMSYTNWGPKMEEYLIMIDSHLQFKLKMDKKRKKQ